MASWQFDWLSDPLCSRLACQSIDLSMATVKLSSFFYFAGLWPLCTVLNGSFLKFCVLPPKQAEESCIFGECVADITTEENRIEVMLWEISGTNSTKKYETWMNYQPSLLPIDLC